MPRIVLVGAGSVEFTRNLLGDFLAYPELRDAEIVLHDIDPDRLSTAQRMASWTAGALGAKPRIRATLDRREALEGADFVVNTIQVGGARATQLDFDVPGRYGLRYTINDTINVGGVLRGLRTIPVVLGIALDIADACPGALFLNYTNPMGMLVRAVDEALGVPTIGLCHSVYWTVHTLAEYLDVPLAEVSAESAGVNHLAWITRLEHRGTDLYPALRAFVKSGRVPDDDLVRADLFGRFGLYPTESSGAPRRVQPVVHRQGRPGRPAPRSDRRISPPRGAQPGRVRGDEAPARRGRAIRDRAERRICGGHRPLDADR
jgi:Alpha-galactosidases/6-phospho-beta-glucosidases, family 4 of glycosyl hydrolases